MQRVIFHAYLLCLFGIAISSEELLLLINAKLLADNCCFVCIWCYIYTTVQKIWGWYDLLCFFFKKSIAYQGCIY